MAKFTIFDVIIEVLVEVEVEAEEEEAGGNDGRELRTDGKTSVGGFVASKERERGGRGVEREREGEFIVVQVECKWGWRGEIFAIFYFFFFVVIIVLFCSSS